MCWLKKTLQQSGLPKAAAKPAFKTVTAKGIAGKSGSLQAGTPNRPGTLKGFGKGGTVKP